MRVVWMMGVYAVCGAAWAGAPSPEPALDPVEEAAGDAPLVHWTKVRVKKRPVVRVRDFPVEALAMDLPDTRCVVRLTVGLDGVPTAIEPRSCPEPYFSSAQKVAMRYQFYPTKVDGVTTIVRLDLVINFAGTGHPILLETSRASLGEAEAMARRRAVCSGEVSVRRSPPLRSFRIQAVPASQRECLVRLTVDPRGRPAGASPVSCSSALWADAEKRLRRYRFHPVLLDGHAVTVAFDVLVDYGVDPPVVSFPEP